MRLSLHIFCALAALGFVSAAVVLGSEQGFKTATPGGIEVCRGDHGSCRPGNLP